MIFVESNEEELRIALLHLLLLYLLLVEFPHFLMICTSWSLVPKGMACQMRYWACATRSWRSRWLRGCLHSMWWWRQASCWRTSGRLQLIRIESFDASAQCIELIF